MFNADTKYLAASLVGNPWATDHNTSPFQVYPKTRCLRAALLTAAEWTGNGFTSVEALAWMGAGAFDADRAAALRDAGLTPDKARVVKVALHSDEPDTSIAYAHSNNDLTIARAVALAA
jgi:hypothetical protein